MIRHHLAVFLIIALSGTAACGSDTMSEGFDQPEFSDVTDQTDTGHDANPSPQDATHDQDVATTPDVSFNDIEPDTDTDKITDTEISDPDATDIDADTPPDKTVYTIAVISDLNGSYGSTTYSQTVHKAVSWITEQVNPNLVLSTGDMVAGQQAGHDYRAMWRSFHNAVTLPITQADIPLAVTPGNHDGSGYAGFANERAIFVDEWKTHRPAVNFLDDSNYPLYYAFELGPALFISLDATRVGPLNQDQRQWVANILETYKTHPVKFVYGHIPLFPVAQGRETEILKDYPFEQLLNEYNVQMMISGHQHAYYPAQRGALRLMHTACLGAGPRKLISDNKVSERNVIVIHYDATGIIASEAYGGPDFQTVIDRTKLPESINSGQMRLYRDDL